MPWNVRESHRDSLETWNSLETRVRLLGRDTDRIPDGLARHCAQRLYTLRRELERSWYGLDSEETGPLVHWVLAALLARENLLLIGPPGTAKTEIATRVFSLLGLSAPQVGDGLADGADEPITRAAWVRRREQERKQDKFFHFLLSRFTQPEELFGPLEITHLRRGVYVRVNFGLLTGAGVLAAFLDEIFKASSSILNTLLTLTSERTYFNWGGQEPADLLMLVGASNEMPGGFGAGLSGLGSGGEDFAALHAFLDRFSIRLNVPAVRATIRPDAGGDDLGKAFGIAVGRESRRFCSGHAFEPAPAGTMPTMNDLLCLGRYAMQSVAMGAEAPDSAFDRNNLEDFQATFLDLARQLQDRGTDVGEPQVTWTISPRKLKGVFKVALAHALVRCDVFHSAGGRIALGPEDLMALALIWDSPLVRPGLEVEVYEYGKRHLARP
jgi:MoxR-like ATPase